MEEFISCPSCGSPDFTVIFNNNGVDRPEYCPFCGDEIDYEELYDSKRDSQE